MITNWLLGLPPRLVYLALFGVVGAESSGLPLPGETSLIAASILASQHEGLSIEIVIAVAALAAIVGDNIGFVLGRHAGRNLLTREGRWMEHRRAFLIRGEAFFEKHGSRAVFLARWLPGLRVVGSWLAGAHHMRWRTFLLWNALGGIAWATSIGIAAYLLGNVAATIIKDFGLIGLAVVVAGGVVFFGAHLVRKRRREAAADTGN
jgi:membrane protein DedA with SNARE-associated domain